MSKDYYKILGVSKDASKEEIKKSFRKLAHEYHPDKGGNQEKFKEISEAYSTLSDDNKRAQYDQYGSAFGQGQGGGAGFNGSGGFEGFDFSGFQNGGGFDGFDVGDIFGDFFGGSRAKPKRGRDISTELDLSFEEAVFGVERKIFLNKTSTCDVCSGTGAKVGTEFSTCKMCNGKGKVQQLKRTILGQIATTKTCEDCHGKGKIPKEKCTNCYGSGVVTKESEISLKIPAGINDGDTMRMTGAGEAISGGATGDLYVKIYVKKHHLFKREGNDLLMDLKIKLTDAILGAEYKIQTLDGEIILKIPEGVTHGEILRVRGKGIPNERGKRGDILIKIQIHIPSKMNKEGKKLVEEMKRLGL